MPVLAKRVYRSVLGAAAVVGLVALGDRAFAGPTVDFDISVLGGTGGPFSDSFSQVGTPTAVPGVFNFQNPPGGYNDPSIFNEWSISVWNFNADPDPAGTGAATGARLGAAFTVTNNRPDDPDPNANHLFFSIQISMPVMPGAQPTSFFGNGGMTLNINDSAFNTPGELEAIGGPIWNYRIDGADVVNLFPAGFVLGGSDGPTTASTSANLSPAQVLPLAGMVPTELGIRLDFDLTPGETVTFNGVFGFIPAPGALALLGLAGLVGTRRRRG